MINRLFSTMRSNVGTNIQDTSSAMQTIINVYLNDIYFDVLKRTNWQAVDNSYNFPTVAGRQDYKLPSNFGKEVYVQDSTNTVQLSSVTLQQMAEDNPNFILTQGQPQFYAVLDSPVWNQPTAAATLSIFSSSAADTTQTVRITGEDTSRNFISEDITLTGQSTVTTSGAYRVIRSISKSAVTTGYITVNSGSVSVATLASADLAYSIKVIRFFPTPSGVITIYCPFIIKPYPMTSDYDQPVIDAADVIELGATMKAWRYKRQFTKAVEYEKQYEKGINTLIWEKENTSNRAQLFHPAPYPRDF
jgi:hypothetical protein